MADARSNEARGKRLQDSLVLVVEDDSRTRSQEKFVLEEEGFPVETVGSGEEALIALSDKHPSLVLLDVGLPESTVSPPASVSGKCPRCPSSWLPPRTGTRTRCMGWIWAPMTT